MGSLIATALIALLLVGLVWRPGLSIAVLGFVVAGLGLAPHVNAPPLPELDAFKRVLGVGSNPPVIAGLFIIGLGRLVMILQRIAGRPAAETATTAGLSRARRDPTLLRHDDRL
ncbi:hypothetical protein [Aureimonas sp. Leaf454]|uniref:hypothetical protein n=1 Tax=Aureimonas sp. Leaf454 TaxID=1736381 RepID=UPI000AB46CD8|nr:hypothetical protein [Aureimonas sp. Leaf454]